MAGESARRNSAGGSHEVSHVSGLLDNVGRERIGMPKSLECKKDSTVGVLGDSYSSLRSGLTAARPRLRRRPMLGTGLARSFFVKRLFTIVKVGGVLDAQTGAVFKKRGAKSRAGRVRASPGKGSQASSKRTGDEADRGGGKVDLARLWARCRGTLESWTFS